MTDRLVDITFDGALATLTLRRPPRNLLSIEMMERVNEALLGLRGQPELKALVIKGAGDTFCGGVDVEDLTKDKIARALQVFHRIFETMRLLDVISVAAVHGDAFGGGFELAIGCNLVLASESARFAVPEIKLGLFPAQACVVLPRAAPRRKAMEWILTGDEVTASELQSYGLVNRVYPDPEFEEGVRGFLAELTTRSGPVMSLAKRAQIESYYAGLEEALYKAENLYLRELLALEDPHEGIRAFLEHREPRWRDG